MSIQEQDLKGTFEKTNEIMSQDMTKVEKIQD